MRRISYIIALLCFVFLLNINGQGKKTLETIQTVEYCDLVREPVKYDGKVIRVSVRYFVAFEGSLMNSISCNKKDTWVIFAPKVKSSTDRKIWKRFDKLTDTSPERTSDGGINYPSRQVSVTWIGLFQGVKPTQTIGKLTLPIGFGHMNGFDFQFTVQKIESVNN